MPQVNEVSWKFLVIYFFEVMFLIFIFLLFFNFNFSFFKSNLKLFKYQFLFF